MLANEELLQSTSGRQEKGNTNVTLDTTRPVYREKQHHCLGAGEGRAQHLFVGSLSSPEAVLLRANQLLYVLVR